LKFGDVVTAVASLVVIDFLLDSVLLAVFVPMNPTGGTAHTVIMVAEILSPLVASLIVGYLFALKIREESRMGAIVSIVVLFTVVMLLGILAMGANPLASPMFKESVDSMYSTSGWTNYHWFVTVFVVVALYSVFNLVLGFIGLYAGSMLRAPKKT
jgi:UDP-N-acetylmuramyl pentapeptide phosphotransferase/UDP-N-acetylglucosamine-1-phosphate transferase